MAGARAAPRERRRACVLVRVSQLQAATPDGSVFVVLDGDRMAVATTGRRSHRGPGLLRPEDPAAPARRRRRAEEGGDAISAGSGWERCSAPARSRARSSTAAAPPPDACRPLLRRRLDALARQGRPTPTACCRSPATCWRRLGDPRRADLGRRLVERAYLEGDFVLRSGRRRRYDIDKYRFETDPDLLGASWARRAAPSRAPADAAGWPAPSWARCRSRR